MEQTPIDKTTLPVYFGEQAKPKPYKPEQGVTIGQVFRDIENRPLHQNMEPHFPFI